MTLVSVGECPICSTSGAVLVLTSRSTGQLVFYCPFCGVAWTEPPPPDRIDDVLALSDVAPAGVRLSTAKELKSLEVEPVEADAYWYEAIEALVNGPAAPGS